jgi:glutaminyl-peptide cyclotransferase
MPSRFAPLLTRLAICGVALGALVGCGGNGSASPKPFGQTGSEPANLEVHVIESYPHDPGAFTQGLVWAGNNQLYESTGLEGQSSLRRVTIASGEVNQRYDLDDKHFGEGLAMVDDRLVQLTWKNKTAFVYDKTTFDQQQTFDYSGEGWGLCYDGERLVMSDGSSTLTFRDATTFDPIGSVDVHRGTKSLSQLNELECVGDRVYANVLGDDNIYEVDPASGDVTAVIDASSLYPERDMRRGEVLNGIAYDPGNGTFYVTGKDWPTLYAVSFEQAS